MSRASWRYGAAISAILVVTAAIVVGFVLFASNRSGGGGNTTTAKLIPATAPIYGVINTDLTSGQWVAAFKLAVRLGQDEPQQRLQDTASSGSGLDWQRDVVPFLGGDAGFYLRSADIGSGIPSLAIVIRCKDAGQAMNVLLKQAGGSFTKASHEGVSYQFDGDKSQFVGRIGDHLILATDEQSMFDVLDVHAGKQKPLDGVAAFKTLYSKLGGNYLGFFYVDAKVLADNALQGNNDVETAMGKAGADFAFKPVGISISAKGNSLQAEAITTGKANAVSALLKSHESRFAKLVPADTAIFVSTSNITQTYNDEIKSNRTGIDDAIAKEGQYRSLDDALTQLGTTFGLASLQDLIKQFTGETAVAVRFPGPNLDAPDFVLIADVPNLKQAQDGFGKVTKAIADSPPKSQKVGGADMFTFTSSGDTLAYTVTDGYVAIGSADSVCAILEKKGQVLADLPGYRNTAAQVSGGLGTFAYIDLASLLTKQIGTSGDIGQAESALQGLLVNLVGDSGALHLTGAVSIGK